jgi:hypothetical protein
MDCRGNPWTLRYHSSEKPESRLVPLSTTIRLHFFSVDKMEIEMQAVVFYYCRQGKEGKKIHRKVSDVYGKDSYSLGAVEYWVQELRAQRTHVHDEVRPGKPLIDVFA